jgi:hypothetical protein
VALAAPVAQGLVANLNRPDANVTGVSFLVATLAATRRFNGSVSRAFSRKISLRGTYCTEARTAAKSQRLPWRGDDFDRRKKDPSRSRSNYALRKRRGVLAGFNSLWPDLNFTLAGFAFPKPLPSAE